MTHSPHETLVARLTAAGLEHRGTDLGGLLQWAALHIASQDEALADTRAELALEERERQRLEVAMTHAKAAIEQALGAVTGAICTPPIFEIDHAPHINLMGVHHKDPDYIGAAGKAVRHTDVRGVAPRKPATKSIATTA